MPKCREVMTPDPATWSRRPDSARCRNHEARGIGAVPVVDSQASPRLVGIVTDRDIVLRVVAAGQSVEGALVREAMTRNPAVIAGKTRTSAMPSGRWLSVRSGVCPSSTRKAG